MSKMEQKVVSESAGKANPELNDSSENDNLGLDADHSSDDDPRYHVNLNNDNDRISHNPDGEDDDRDTSEEKGHSPLMDK
jgi:hypothetical protein